MALAGPGAGWPASIQRPAAGHAAAYPPAPGACPLHALFRPHMVGRWPTVPRVTRTTSRGAASAVFGQFTHLVSEASGWAYGIVFLLAYWGAWPWLYSKLIAPRFVSGFVGGVFVLLFLLVSRLTGRSRNAGWPFATAGLGGAVLSWLTGTVSSSTGSLRIGLMVPGAAALLMMVLITWRRTNQERPGDQQERILQPTITGNS